jgi:hypothetical protein
VSKVLLKQGGILAKYGVLCKSDTSYTFHDSTLDAKSSYLKAAWKLDSLTDYIGANNLTMNGTVSNVIDAVHGGVSVFDGNTANYLSISSVVDGSVLLPSSASGAKYTVNVWVKLHTLPDGSYVGADVLGCGRYTYNKWNIAFNKSGGHYTTQFQGMTSAGGWLNAGANYDALTTGVWYMMTLVFNGSTIDSYVNAEYQASSIGYTTLSTEGTNAFSVGRCSDLQSWNNLDGEVAGISIWKDEALSSTDITLLYNSGVGKHISKGPAAAFPISYTKCYSDSLYNAVRPYIVANWNFDKDLTSDSAGSNTLTNNGVTSVAGMNNSAASFNGSSQYFTATYTTNFNWYSEPFSISMWNYINVHKSAFVGGLNIPLQIGNMEFNSGDDNWCFGTNVDGYVYFYYWTGTPHSVIGTTVRNTGEWLHLVMTFDNTNIKLYVNGVNDGSAAKTGSPQSSVGIPLTIGSYADEFYNGLIDEITIIKGYALTQANITELYNNGLGKYYRTKSNIVPLGV